jgi:Clp amino terminal domain, pathogenicity island component
MFQGDHPELGRVLSHAPALARAFGHPRVGSEHLLLALTTAGGTVAPVLAEHGATPAAVRWAMGGAAPLGAGEAADRDLLATLGIDIGRLLSDTRIAPLDRPSRESLLPLGAATARRRAARMSPPFGLDAQAAYEASLRLALARRERGHRPEHLALTLVAHDPGVAWVLGAADVDPRMLLADLAAAFPPPRRNALLRAERRLGRQHRYQGLVRRYQRTTGRTVVGVVPTSSAWDGWV